ncbi:hypothetical protein C8Q77DRAFT_1160051 [Trametes polyzona]|nr:hypothetical protein C8Q77DRAFT_1160051 [Trametes polyzona]
MPLVYEVNFNLPPELYPGRIEAFEDYILLQEEVFYDYRSPPHYRDLWRKSLRRIKQYPGHKLEHGLQLTDAPMMLEYCVRVLSLCEVPITLSSMDHVTEVLQRITRVAGASGVPHRPAKVDNLTRHIQLQALAASAYHMFYGFWSTPDADSLQGIKSGYLLPNAIFAISQCVEKDFIPPIVLHIVGWLATTRARYGVDLRKLNRFREYRPLWRAYDTYLSTLRTRENLRLEKVALAPHQYRCANEGCEIQAIDKHALRRCAGRCPADRKAHYCSSYCQRRHWPIHREFCKSDTTNEFPDIVDDDGDPNWVDVDDFRAPAVPDKDFRRDWPLWAEREGPEIFIDIANDSPFRKGEIFRIRTKTLSPECLKAYKRLWSVRLNQITRKVLEAEFLDPPENMGFPT